MLEPEVAIPMANARWSGPNLAAMKDMLGIQSIPDPRPMSMHWVKKIW